MANSLSNNGFYSFTAHNADTSGDPANLGGLWPLPDPQRLTPPTAGTPLNPVSRLRARLCAAFTYRDAYRAADAVVRERKTCLRTKLKG
jgi:hypothetical protein